MTNLRNKVSDLRYKSKNIDFSVLLASPSGEAGATYEDKEAELIMPWLKLEENASRLLGKDIVLQAAPQAVYVPNWAQLTAIIQSCDKDNDHILRKSVADRKDAAKKLNTWDWEKNCGRGAFRSARENDVPPTTHLAHPTEKRAIHL